MAQASHNWDIEYEWKFEKGSALHVLFHRKKFGEKMVSNEIKGPMGTAWLLEVYPRGLHQAGFTELVIHRKRIANKMFERIVAAVKTDWELSCPDLGILCRSTKRKEMFRLPKNSQAWEHHIAPYRNFPEREGFTLILRLNVWECFDLEGEVMEAVEETGVLETVAARFEDLEAKQVERDGKLDKMAKMLEDLAKNKNNCKDQRNGQDGTQKAHLEKVKKWLCDELELPEYVDAFAEMGYDRMGLLSTLRVSDLIDMGITKKGHQRAILRSIEDFSRPAKRQQQNNPNSHSISSS